MLRERSRPAADRLEATDLPAVRNRERICYRPRQVQCSDGCSAANALGQIDLPIRQLFGRMSAERRINLARKRLLPDFTKAGLGAEMKESLRDLDWCRGLRNQYAHCQWGWTSADGLFFVNLEQLADQQDPISNVMDQRCYIDVPLLQEQEAYCNYVREFFTYLDTAYRAWDRAKVAVTPPSHIHPKPSTITRPPLHK